MLDLRLPIGWFFIINSLLLIGVGFANPQRVPFEGADVNLNMVWGSVMGLFGLFMAGIAYKDKFARTDKKD